MLRAHYQNKLILQDWKCLDIPIRWFRSHQRKINAAFQYLTRQAAGHVSKDLYLHIGMLLAIIQNELRQEIERRTLIRPDTNTSPLQTLHLCNRLAHLIAQTEDPLRVVVNHLPHFSEDRSLLCPIKER